MKHQVLTQKVSAFIFMGLLFLSYSIRAVAHGNLEFTEGESAIREIAENTAAGTTIGEPLRYSIGDIFDCVDLSLHGPDAQAFDVVRVYKGAQLKTKSALDYETKNTYVVQITAVGQSTIWDRDTITVTIVVTNVNETPVSSEGTEFVEIPDPSLAAMIRLTLGLASGDGITEETMLELTRLDAGPKSRLVGLREIEDLAGLEYAKNLTTLLLTSNSVRDLTPLAGLTQLTTLEIYGNKIVSLTPLKNLTNLNKLQLGFNWIHDITPLTGLTNLTELLIRSNNRIKDITPLQGLINLRTLDLGGNLITDISPLRGLTNLRTLHLRNNNRLTDIRPLAGLVNLETLTLKGCPITDFSPLEGLTASIDVLGGSAPSVNGDAIDSLLDPVMLQTLGREILLTQLQALRVESDGSLKYQRAIALLKSVLASIAPDKTVLLSNYPNPFNPETWIPYHLSKSTDVQITIYDTYGTIVRHLGLGHQAAGYYTNRSHSAHWDGRNDFGERVASGVYFYQLQADTISPMKKMVVLK